TTLSTKGNLNQGQVTVHNWYTPASANLGFTSTTGNTLVKGFNLVGNPYASSINWDLFNTTTTTSGIYGSAVGTTIYVYDPSSKNYGAYTKGVGTGTHNASAILPSGQGFFVVTTAATAKLIFNESAKVYTQATGLNLLMGRPTEYVVNQSLRLQLAQDSVNTDDLLIRFSNNASATYDPEVDAPYKQGYGAVSLASLSSDQIPLAINLQPSPKKRETIALSANAINDGTYKLSLTSIKGIPQLFDIWLVDGYTRDSVNMRKTPDYSFSILKSDTNTYGSKRFKLVLSENADYAYKLVDFAAYKITSAASKQVQVTWTAVNEQNYTSFTLERSIDTGKTYEVLHGVQSSGQGTYSFIDKYPVTGQNLYRLKQDDINDSVSYSKIIPVEFSNLSNSLVKNNVNVYPNPASSVINLTISPDIKASGYKIHITNSLGMLVKEVTSAQPNWQSSVKELQNGTYFIKVVNSQDQTLIGQTKFVKL
ncbi:MAG: T9SS type A sorting domain-containing protein, partial [Mucilaginibacter sp.]